jgi:hypothetical protein
MSRAPLLSSPGWIGFDTVHDQAGPLFDLRGALQLRMAIYGAAGPGRSRETQLGQRNAPHRTHGMDLRLFFHPDAELTEVAGRAAFYPGDVPGLPDTRPDFAGAQSLPERRRGMTRSDHHLRGTYWGT